MQTVFVIYIVYNALFGRLRFGRGVGLGVGTF